MTAVGRRGGELAGAPGSNGDKGGPAPKGARLGPIFLTTEEVEERLEIEKELRKKVGVIDLPCYKVSVYHSEGYLWNGWVRGWRENPLRETPDDVDRWLPSGGGVGQNTFYISANDPASFEAGAYWFALEHIYLCDVCRMYNRYTMMAVCKKLHMIQREWERTVGKVSE